MYPLTIHCRLSCVKPRSRLIEGSAMLRIDASRMSMNWTRQSRIRIATPRRDESDEASCACRVDTELEYVSAVIAGVSFRLASQGEDTGRRRNVTSHPGALAGLLL